MEQYIPKADLAANIEARYNECLQRAKIIDAEYWNGKADAYRDMLVVLDDLEVKDMSVPALDNGNMPVERWKEACEAASCQANYRKSKGLTETCDDYFVDGVQWADEHPKKAKEC